MNILDTMNDTNDIYDEKTDLEHIRDKSFFYMGGKDPVKTDELIYDNVKNQFTYETCMTNPALLKIFDEVITGFGRLGTATASEYFGVTPDIISCAKAITNGIIPMGAAVVSKKIYESAIKKEKLIYN